MRRIYLLSLIAGCLFLQACSTLPPFPSRAPAAAKLPADIPLEDFAGIFHVHSRYSHDSKGKMDEIAQAAIRAHLDFVIVTDHNTLEGIRERMDGMYGPVLISFGSEMSTGAGHLAVLGLREELSREREPGDIVREAGEKGALTFAAHGESPRTPWKEWGIAGMTGMEIYNLASDVYEDGKTRVAFKAIFYPPRTFFRSVMDRPAAYLKRWDEIQASRPFVGVGAVDAHQKVRLFGRAIDRYDTMFRVVQTHVYAPELTEDEIFKGLKGGHVYVAFDIVRPVRNFLFTAEGDQGKSIMGDTVEGSGVTLKVYVPEKAEIRLLKNGKVIKAERTSLLQMAPDGPGAYRAEVYRKKKLWIISNPIYVK